MFQQNRSLIDIFPFRQLIEKTGKQKNSLFITFIEVKKTFDAVNRTGLWKPLLHLIMQFYVETKNKSINGERSDTFNISIVIKQGNA